MDERDLDPDPIAQFRAWLAQAQDVSPCADAMTLATTTRDGRPSARIVLLRTVDDRGFVFFTNRSSRKGRELEDNPHAALVLHWYELGRQARIEGRVEEVDIAESTEYWQTRPRGSQIAAWASPQSQELSSRAELDRLYEAAETELGTDDIALPPFWGGYRVVPDAIEFWHHHENRLHDRVRYELSDDGWKRRRLAP